MKALASTDDPALAAWLGSLQEASFSRAGGAVRKAYPPERRMTGPQLAGYLARRTYALASSTRRDGRPHAAPTLFSIYAEAFWLPTLGGAARLGNVRSHPWLALSIIEVSMTPTLRCSPRAPPRCWRPFPRTSGASPGCATAAAAWTGQRPGCG